MDISRKASITVSAKLSADEVKAALLAAVGAAAPSPTLAFMSSSVSMSADGSAMVELVYEKSEAMVPGTDDSDGADAQPAAGVQPGTPVVVTPVIPPVMMVSTGTN